MLLSSAIVDQRYPRHYISPALEELWTLGRAADDSLVAVMDDDPTGIQTVHGIPVYWEVSAETAEDACRSSSRIAFFQTNSRSMTGEEAKSNAEQWMKHIAEASRRAGRPFRIVSRGDSTLRGHYPLEIDALHDVYRRETGASWDGEILIPFFQEGGRITIDDVHYINDGARCIPVGETEFANDTTFAFHSSDLKAYIEEKRGGAYPAERVLSVPLRALREEDVEGVFRLLRSVAGFGKVVVNAVSMDDMKVFTVALRKAEESGKSYVFRTGASFVKAYAGIGDIPLRTGEDLLPPSRRPGVVVVGSHTQRTTAQLRKLLELPYTVPVEVRVESLLGPMREREIAASAERAAKAWEAGAVPVLFTSRTVASVERNASERNLKVSVSISDALAAVLRAFEEPPAFVIAKGGITSSDLGTKGLRIRKAMIHGQLRPGVPVIGCGEGSKWPGMPYVIFPGNVGTDDDLYLAADTLHQAYLKHARQRR